jgi:hypothetical protein
MEFSRPRTLKIRGVSPSYAHNSRARLVTSSSFGCQVALSSCARLRRHACIRYPVRCIDGALERLGTFQTELRSWRIGRVTRWASLRKGRTAFHTEFRAVRIFSSALGATHRRSPNGSPAVHTKPVSGSIAKARFGPPGEPRVGLGNGHLPTAKTTLASVQSRYDEIVASQRKQDGYRFWAQSLLPKCHLPA